MFQRVIAAAIACCCTAALFTCVPTGTSGDALVANGSASGAQRGAISKSPTASIALNRNVYGQWDIEQFEGYEPTRLHGRERAAYADFGPDSTALRMECNPAIISGQIMGGRFIASSAAHAQSQWECPRAVLQREAALFTFFEAAPALELLADGRLRLRTETQVLLLDRPVNRRIAFIPDEAYLDLTWRLHSISVTGGASGDDTAMLTDVPGHISFTNGVMRYEHCPDYDMAFRIDDRGRLAAIGERSLPDPASQCVDGADTKAPSPFRQAMQLLHDTPELEISRGDVLLISKDNQVLMLTKAT